MFTTSTDRIAEEEVGGDKWGSFLVSAMKEHLLTDPLMKV